MNSKNQYILYLAIFFSDILKPAFLHIQVLREGGMTDSTSWFIYNLASVNKAKLEFNYTLQKPIQGVNGCMRINKLVKR
ncbi:MAG: hypothetical protein H7141_01315 [Burkholderiales bacterium]|nr:hypothetical protein [Bacteroidia bacterium]